MNWLKETLDWSEVWAPIIPLAVYFYKKPKASWIKPVLIYLLVTLIFSIIVDVTWKSKSLGLEAFCQKIFWWLYIGDKKELYNTIFYNLISFARLLLFTWLFQIIINDNKKLYKVIFLFFVLFVALNFGFFENIREFSSRQLATEAAIILFYCLLYFYKVNMDD